MRYPFTTLAILASSALFAACQGKVLGIAPQRGMLGGNGGDGGSGGSGVTMPNPSTVTQEVAKARCDKSSSGPPVLRRLTRQEFQNTAVDIFPQLGTGWGGVKLGTDSVSPLGFANDAATLVVAQQTAQEILSTAEDIATQITAAPTLAAVLPCSATTPDATCAGQFITQYGTRLFRRPLSADETKRYTDYFTSVSGRSTFPMGIKWTLVALFQSPNAVYRSEIGVANGANYTLSQHEIASELAYTFGGSTPSPDLLAKADAGALATPDARLAEARALLATPNGKETVRELFREWSGYTVVKARSKKNSTNFTALSADMVNETQQFIDDVVFTRQGSLSDLLTAPYTFLNANLASFYGYGGATDFTKTDRPATYGIGLLAQGSVLAANAHEDASSPTWRGLLIFSKMFCNTRPKPPAGVPPLDTTNITAKTTRQRYEDIHIKQGGACPACHTLWDPIGFGFEHYDEIGRYRETENGQPIDASGYVETTDGKQALTFNGESDLATQLAKDPDVTACVSGLISEYVYAGGGGVSCLAEEARTGLAAGQFGLLEYLAQLSTEPQFSQRSLASH